MVETRSPDCELVNLASSGVGVAASHDASWGELMLYEHMSPFNGRLEEFGQQTFAQFGEDIALFGWLETLRLNSPSGFYVDIGAYHPRAGSNTYLLRKLLGWKGINVEADPALYARFVDECPDCININAAVGGTQRRDRLTIYNHPGANTITEAMRARQSANSALEIRAEIEVDVISVNTMLEKYLPADAQFRVLSIDIEGMDAEVIEAFDFTRWRPPLILIEDFEIDLRDPTKSRIFRRMKEAKYLPCSQCMPTTLYRTLI